MHYPITINGIPVEAHYTEENIQKIFLPLLQKLQHLQKEKGRRLLVYVAAPPGAGKSTLVSFLEALWKEHFSEATLQAIGMDGFHRRQDYLLTHTAQVDGVELPMVKIKGAPITFDLPLLQKAITDLLTKKELGWPSYDRHLHNPVENAILVTGDIILLEGNYLLLEEDGWQDLPSLADFTIFVSADATMLQKRLIDRKEASGNSREEAEKFVHFSDMKNVRTCLEHSQKADVTLLLQENDSYTLLDESHF